MMRYQVTHRTTYRYDAPVAVSYGQSCLLPRNFDGQRCLQAGLEINPAPEDLREREDFFGNRATYFRVDIDHEELDIVATSEVEVERSVATVEGGPTLSETQGALDRLKGRERTNAAHYRLDTDRTTADDQVRRFADISFRLDQPVQACLTDLMARIHAEFEFDATTTTVTSTLDDLFEHGAGVCQDFAHLTVACLRAEGIPARYMSGYLETIPPPGQPRLVGNDVSHAWASAYVPNSGWIDLDPTNNQFVDDRYVTIGWGRDYGDVPPLKGVIYSDSSETELDVSVDVVRTD